MAKVKIENGSGKSLKVVHMESVPEIGELLQVYQGEVEILRGRITDVHHKIIEIDGVSEHWAIVIILEQRI